MTLRPPRGHCLVRTLPGLAADLGGSVARPDTGRSLGYYCAEVVACGADVDAVRPGDTVLVEAQSGHDGADLRGDLVGGSDEDRLVVVPCRARALPPQRREEEYAYRIKRASIVRREVLPNMESPFMKSQATVAAVRRFYPELPMSAAAIAAMVAEDEDEVRAIRASRKGKRRSRLIHPTKDVGAVADGILAVIEL